MRLSVESTPMVNPSQPVIRITGPPVFGNWIVSAPTYPYYIVGVQRKNPRNCLIWAFYYLIRPYYTVVQVFRDDSGAA